MDSTRRRGFKVSGKLAKIPFLCFRGAVDQSGNKTGVGLAANWGLQHGLVVRAWLRCDCFEFFSIVTDFGVGALERRIVI